MKLTKAQKELLGYLENGAEVTFFDGHYVVGDEDGGKKIWPSTFYGLFDNRMVEKLDNGNYTISDHGKQQIRSKNK